MWVWGRECVKNAWMEVTPPLTHGVTLPDTHGVSAGAGMGVGNGVIDDVRVAEDGRVRVLVAVVDEFGECDALSVLVIMTEGVLDLVAVWLPDGEGGGHTGLRSHRDSCTVRNSPSPRGRPPPSRSEGYPACPKLLNPQHFSRPVSLMAQVTPSPPA